MAYIIMGILSILGTAAYFVIRANQVAQAGRGLGEAAADVKKMVRRSKWRGKANVDALREIDDPRLAATVMMVAIAKSEGDLTESQKKTILDQVETRLQIGGDAAQELFVHARWLISDLGDVDTVVRRTTRPVAARCTDGEKSELIDMLRTVADVEGGMTDALANVIDRLALSLGVSD